jgi:hypothetical protein
MELSGIYGYTGWHTQASSNREKRGLSYVEPYNALMVAGYFPIIGICTGICHIETAKQGNQLATTQVYLITRGVLEIAGLGSLFSIPDFIVSIHRHYCVSAPNSHLSRQ